MSDLTRRVLIVTPTYNSEAFLDETIYSVISQAGRGVSLHYHLQDGGSQDGTLAMIERWVKRVAQSELPVLCDSLDLTYASERDDGMYDALNRGFARLDPRPEDVLTWINSDDRLNSGAVSTVCAAMRDVPECQFVSGRISLINEEGAVTTIKGPGSYPRAALAAGLHDGRREVFVMQEGTFFTGALWLAVGGMDARFRLAGDWDLWRRMAQCAELYGIDAVTAYHRRRRGQLSADISRYDEEVDTWRADQIAYVSADQQTSNLIRFEGDSACWVSAPFSAAESPPPDVTRPGRLARGCHFRFHEGFAPPEGPYPEYHLPNGVRWMDGFEGRIWVTAAINGHHRVRAKVRSAVHDLIFTARINGQEMLRAVIPNALPMKDEVIEFRCWLHAGLNDFHVLTEARDTRERRLLMVELEVIEHNIATDEVEALAAATSTTLTTEIAEHLAVIIRLRDRLDLLDVTVGSVRAEAGPRAHITIVNENSATPASLLVALSSRIDSVVDATLSTHGIIAELTSTLRRMGLEQVLELESGDVLAPGGLACAVSLMIRSKTGAVRGLHASRDTTGAVVSRVLSSPEALASRHALVSLRTAETTSTIDMARLLVISLEAAEEQVLSWAASGPRMLLIDRRQEKTVARSRLFNVAAALAMLGFDVRHVDVPSWIGNAVLSRVGGCIVMTDSARVESREETIVTLESDKEFWSYNQISDLPSPGVELRLPAAIDTAVLRPRAKWDCRIRFGLPQSAPIILIDVGDWTDTVLSQALAKICIIHGAILLNAGKTALPSELVPFSDYSSASLSDPMVASFQLNAADLVIQHDGQWTDLPLAVAACGVPLLDSTGRLLTPNGNFESIASDMVATVARFITEPGLRSSIGVYLRGLVESEWSLEALAAQIRREAPRLSAIPRLSEWLDGPGQLQVGPIAVRSGCVTGMNASVFPTMLGLRIVPLEGAQPISPGPSRLTAPFAMRLTADVAVLAIELLQFPAEQLDLQLYSKGLDAWRFNLNDAEVIVNFSNACTANIFLFTQLKTGFNRLVITRITESEDISSPSLELIGCRLLSIGAQREPLPGDPSAITVAPLSGAYSEWLYRDGDWRRGPEFFPPEPPRPDLGMHAGFQWSRGRRCRLTVKVERAGLRAIRLAVTGFLEGQQVRLVVAGVAYDWSPRLEGDRKTGRIELLEWVLPLREGVVEVVVELSISSGDAFRDLGIIIVDLQLGDFLVDAAPSSAKAALLST